MLLTILNLFGLKILQLPVHMARGLLYGPLLVLQGLLSLLRIFAPGSKCMLVAKKKLMSTNAALYPSITCI